MRKYLCAALLALIILPAMPAAAHNTPFHCGHHTYYGSRWTETYVFHTTYGGIHYNVYKHFDWFTGRSHWQWNVCPT